MFVVLFFVLQGSFFQPYLPLQQIDQLQQSKTYLVGTTNSIIQQQRDCNIDVVVNVRLSLSLSPSPLSTLPPPSLNFEFELTSEGISDFV